jgi:nicotinate-nucleotide pyrophosphorylase (carboxylating)
LFDAVLIKDNHLAFGAHECSGHGFSPAEAVERARQFLADLPPQHSSHDTIVEVEIDSLEQLQQALTKSPDIVLLDNLPLDRLRDCVALRDKMAPTVELEASGGVTLQNVRAIAETGVDRISVGALTHSAPWFDIALDWKV